MTEPLIQTVGLSGVLITFAQTMSEPANRAALAFRAAVEEAEWPEVAETSTSLVSLSASTSRAKAWPLSAFEGSAK